MKTNTMNDRQKKAFMNVKYAAYNLLGGLENTTMDYEEDTPEFQYADEMLGDRESLKEEIYRMATTGVYREGFEGFGPQYAKVVNDIKFLGKEYIMSLIDDRLCIEGY